MSERGERVGKDSLTLRNKSHNLLNINELCDFLIKAGTKTEHVQQLLDGDDLDLSGRKKWFL